MCKYTTFQHAYTIGHTVLLHIISDRFAIVRNNLLWGGRKMHYFKLRGPSYIHDNEVSEYYRLIYPIISEADELYWFMDLAAGPVEFLWAFETNNEQMIDDNIIGNVPFASTSASLHKPGMISKYGRHLVDDECAYYIGLQADSDEVATSKATYLFQAEYPDVDNKDFIKTFKANAVLYARYTWYRSTGLIWDVIFNGNFNFIQTFLDYHHKSEMLIDEIFE